MKLTCTQENLHKGLIKVHGIASTATSLPILKNILLEAKNNSLKLKSTDLEIGVTTEVRGKIEREGEITIEAKLINNFVGLLPQNSVNISADKKILTIKSGSHQTKINGELSEDFPVIPKIGHEKGFVVGSDIKKALLQVMPAVSTDDTRPEINGVYFNVEDTTLTLVGTDSYRLAEKKLNLLETKNFSGSFIVPLKTVKEFVKTLDEYVEHVSIYVADNQVLFVYNTTEMVSRLVDGEYPDYKQIIPSSCTTSFTISREEFASSVKISSIFAVVGGNSVTLELYPQKNVLSVSSSTTSGKEQTDLSVDMDGDGDIKIVFDYRYMLDGLNSIESSEVIFWANSEASPVLIKPAQPKESLIYIVMPIRQ